MDAEARESGWVAIGGAVLAAVVVSLLIEPIGRDASHFGRALLAGAGVALALARFVQSRLGSGPGAVTRTRAALAGLCTLGWFNYFQFDPHVFNGINDYTDTAYYYTNSKYLRELGYDGLYAAALLCDEERGSPRTGHVRTIRDLRDDELRTRAEELEHGREVKANFTEERWAAFCHDANFFLEKLDKKSLASNFFVDHGYNPPPTWSVIGGNLALAVDVSHLKWICHVDTVLVIAMFGAAWWAFGVETSLWVMLFYVTTFSGRWPILGMAITRFDWVVALVVGMAMLRAQRYGLAGASLAYAALNRVFPAIFLWGWMVEAALDVWRERRIAPKHVRFAAAAGAMTLLLTGVAAVEYGPTTLSESAYHLRLHNESFSSHRVGLGTVAVYRFERTRAQINEFRYAGLRGMAAKEQRVRALKLVLRGAGVLCLGLIALYAWRMDRSGRKVDAWELLPLVALPLWCATTPQVNYYNFRAVLFAWHGGQLRDPMHAAGMALLLATEVAAQLAHVYDFDRHPVNAITSYGMLVYFVVVGVWLAVRAGAAPAFAPEPASAPSAPAEPVPAP